MDNLEGRKRLLLRILAVILIVVLCCSLPGNILFWTLCTAQDLNLPPNTAVLVSACKQPFATGVPGGKFVFVHERRTDKIYLLDLGTGEKRKVPDDPLLLSHGIFLSPEFVWLEGTTGGTRRPGYRPHYILDLTNGIRYELTDLSVWVDQPVPPDYIPYFQSAGQVFIHHGNNMAIALPPDFRQNPAEGVILYRDQLNAETDFENGELLEMIMKDLGVKYKGVDYSLRDASIPSPFGTYIARGDGIYLNGMGAPITVDMYFIYDFAGWYYDESGIVYNRPGYCLFNFLANCLYWAPGNVLRLNLSTP